MSETLATDFHEIIPVLSQNHELRSATLNLIDTEPVAGKATEGGNRLSQFRQILQDLVNNEVDVHEAFARVNRELSRSTSLHSGNNRVFADG